MVNRLRVISGLVAILLSVTFVEFGTDAGERTKSYVNVSTDTTSTDTISTDNTSNKNTFVSEGADRNCAIYRRSYDKGNTYITESGLRVKFIDGFSISDHDWNLVEAVYDSNGQDITFNVSKQFTGSDYRNAIFEVERTGNWKDVAGIGDNEYLKTVDDEKENRSEDYSKRAEDFTKTQFANRLKEVLKRQHNIENDIDCGLKFETDDRIVKLSEFMDNRNIWSMSIDNLTKTVKVEIVYDYELATSEISWRETDERALQQAFNYIFDCEEMYCSLSAGRWGEDFINNELGLGSFDKYSPREFDEKKTVIGKNMTYDVICLSDDWEEGMVWTYYIVEEKEIESSRV